MSSYMVQGTGKVVNARLWPGSHSAGTRVVDVGLSMAILV